ncbi:hypothetical protein [Spirulina sp. 06S082]|uniref:hypothetical protein n=1 Tax=Spirulina sp. 06S082 TaxID=3110248 RepID=UPI002B20C3FA|nr:hypothetical protein [Spirulina sp. 06S082]
MNAQDLLIFKENNMDNQNQSGANYDRKIVSAETAARMEREGDGFKDKPLQEGSINTVEGFTVDREGLLNNYAVEPEMYINEPGDLQEKAE